MRGQYAVTDRALALMIALTIALSVGVTIVVVDATTTTAEEMCEELDWGFEEGFLYGTDLCVPPTPGS